MTALSQTLLPARAALTNEPIFRLSVDQYHELIRSGKLTEDDPVELLEGILVFKMPKKSPHATSAQLAQREIGGRLPAGCHYRPQDPITLEDGEPEPDGAIAAGRIEDYAAGHPVPADVVMVIEVSDSSLERDRGIKLRSYARAKIPLYWIINLVDRQLETYSNPVSPAGGDPTYEKRLLYRGEDLVPLTVLDAPTTSIRVATLFPPE